MIRGLLRCPIYLLPTLTDTIAADNLPTLLSALSDLKAMTSEQADLVEWLRSPPPKTTHGGVGLIA